MMAIKLDVVREIFNTGKIGFLRACYTRFPVGKYARKVLSYLKLSNACGLYANT